MIDSLSTPDPSLLHRWGTLSRNRRLCIQEFVKLRGPDCELNVTLIASGTNRTNSSQLTTVDSPLFFREIVYVDRWVRLATILVSWCERNWEGYKITVGTDGGANSVEERGCREKLDALQHPYPRAFCTLPSFARIKRPLKMAPVELNDLAEK